MTRRPRRTGRRSASRPRFTWGLVLVLLVIVGAVALERAALLPEPLAGVVRQAERWLAPVLEELGLDLPGVQDTGAEPTSRNDDRAAVAQALDLLETISVQDERPRGYDREDWPHWLDLDGDCMDARQEVLVAESLEAVQLTADGCRVVSGLWRDAYTGETYTDPTRLDVDHFVPLAEAYRSGGRDWSTDRRAAFANDLEDSRGLIAVSAAANRSKSDQGPEEWLPPEVAYHCRYAADWVAVKARWSLSMDERERVAVGNLLRACTSG